MKLTEAQAPTGFSQSTWPDNIDAESFFAIEK
jgi:hypothetical protein